jgi:hypothetical protein
MCVTQRKEESELNYSSNIPELLYKTIRNMHPCDYRAKLYRPWKKFVCDPQKMAKIFRIYTKNNKWRRD